MKKKINLDDLIKNKKKIKIKQKKKTVRKKHSNTVQKNEKDSIVKNRIRKHENNTDISKTIEFNNIMNEKNTEKEIEEIREYVAFRIDNEEYGIDSDYVRQIMKFQKPLDMGIKSDIIIGLINTKDGIIPVINLRERFNLNKEIKANGSIIIINFGSLRVGIYVDYLIGIVRLEANRIKDIPDFLPADKMKYINGIGLRENDKIIIILNHKTILTEQDLMELKALPEKYQ